MIIKEITAKALPDFIQSDEYLKSNIIPISQHRALSHTMNPRVDPDDVVLFLVYVDDEIAGYIGILADHFFINGLPEKIGWISCLWIDPTSTGKGIVKKLLKQAFLRWNNKVLITNYSPDVKGTYIRSGLFMEPFTKPGVRGYLRFNFHELLPTKKKVFQQWSWLLKVGDAVLNVGNETRLFVTQVFNKHGDSRIEVLSEIDQETNAFIKKHQQDNLPKRSSDELNWIVKYPWILEGVHKTSVQQRYYFSSISKQFVQVPIKILDEHKQIKIFLYITIRNKHLKVHYVYFSGVDTKEVAAVIYTQALKYRCNMVTVFDPILNEYIFNNPSPFLFKKKLTQEYFASKAFEGKLAAHPSDEFQYGDGDGVFT
jgi:hypothetical protein